MSALLNSRRLNQSTDKARVSDPAMPTFASVQSELSQLELGIDADELHGSLCGFLSAAGSASVLDWPTQLALDAVASERLSADQPLGALYVCSVHQLGDPQLGLVLLLPDEDDVEVRANALLAWCRGFLGGFGLAGGNAQSEDSREALSDLANIASSALSFDDPERDASSLEELIEFVRVAVLLLYAELDSDGEPSPSTLH